jgi:hypothetical protein
VLVQQGVFIYRLLEEKQVYLNKGLFIGCRQTDKKKHSIKPIVLVRTTGCSTKNSIFSSRHLFTEKQFTSLFMAAAHLQV